MELTYRFSLFDRTTDVDGLPQHSMGHQFEEANQSSVDLRCSSLKFDLLANTPKTIDLSTCFEINNTKAILIKSEDAIRVIGRRGTTEFLKADSNLLFVNRESTTSYPYDPNQLLTLEFTSLTANKVYLYLAGK